MQTTTFFVATKKHLVKVIESSRRYKVRFQLECFPLPSVHETPESDFLYASHRSRLAYGPKLRQCTVMHESPLDPNTGRMSFTLCGLNTFSDGNRLEITEVFLEPDGSISFMEFRFTRYLLRSFCVGLSRRHAYGVGLRMNGQPLVFALDYQGPGSFAFKYAALDYRFPESELLALDTFGGTAFFSRRSSNHTFLEAVDFIRDAKKAESRLVSLWKRSLGQG